MTPKALSAEELEAHLDALERAGFIVVVGELRAHIVALEADNAALLWLVPPPTYREIPDCWCPPQDGPAPHTEACIRLKAMPKPHPGAALLERHEKALVRARNEGRKQARRLVNTYAALEIARGRDHVGVDALADEIDALKEPEQ